MWIVYNVDTGYSDESMRFAHLWQADAFIQMYSDQNLAKRWEED